MELEGSLEKYQQQGLGVVAISYDNPAILKHFADRMGISYPLLSDPDSKIIRSFGILNTNLPEGHFLHGIPFPGTYVVDSEGRVVSKYFEQWHRQRFTADTILVREFGLEGEQKNEVRTEHLTVNTSVSQVGIRPGNRVSVILDIELPEGMHIYAPGAEGYKVVSLNINEDPVLKIQDTQYPEPEIMYLEVIKERVPIYHRKVRISRDITLSPLSRATDLTIAGEFNYQACDDEICYLPVSVPLEFELQVLPHDTDRSPESIRNKPLQPKRP